MKPPEEKIRVISITNSHGAGAYVLNKENLGSIADEIEALLEGGETGESLIATVTEMTQAEFDALPEFAGW